MTSAATTKKRNALLRSRDAFESEHLDEIRDACRALEEKANALSRTIAERGSTRRGGAKSLASDRAETAERERRLANIRVLIFATEAALLEELHAAAWAQATVRRSRVSH